VAAASGGDLAVAIDAFLSQPDLASTTRVKYRQTLAVTEDELGDAPVTGASLAAMVAQRWHRASPATSSCGAAPSSTTTPAASPLRACSGSGSAATSTCTNAPSGGCLYETAARADEVLRLDVEDLDIAGKRAHTRSKGGDVDWLFFGSGTRRAAGALSQWGRRCCAAAECTVRRPAR
jgi:hypothetical protein